MYNLRVHSSIMYPHKKIQLTAFLALTLTLFSACSLGGFSYKTESLDALGVKIEKPRQWSSARTESGDNYVDYIIEVPESSNGNNSIAGRMSINLVKPLEGEIVKIEDEVNGLKQLFSSNITDLKTIEEVDTTLMGMPAKRVKLQFRNNEDKTTLENAVFTVTVKDNNAYVILFDDDAADFEKYYQVYEKMTASMQPL